MGAVYKARQPSLDRLVALKILPPTVANDPGFAERFNREARALARLSHPNIVAVHDFGQAGGLNYLLMELVDGANLREMEQAGRLTPQQALAIVPQICEALQFAHNEGIVHRDIKPENLLIDKKGRVKITDFGIAKIIGISPEKVSLTGAKDVMGTPHYMAPEQIERPQEVDHRADIYSLGVVFYEMLTGELPLGKFQAPSQKVQMDVRIDEVVLRTLEKEPGRRYQQVGEVKTRVETIAGTPGTIGMAPSSSPLPHDVSDKRILPAFLLALFFGVFGAHRFYVGKTRTAWIQLGGLILWIPLILTEVALGIYNGPVLAMTSTGLALAGVVIGCGIWATVDWIVLACKGFTDGQGRRMIYWNDPLPGNNPPPSKAPGASQNLSSRNPAAANAPAAALIVVGALRIFSGIKTVAIIGGLGAFLAGKQLFTLSVHSSFLLKLLAVLGTLLVVAAPSVIAISGGVEMLKRRNYPWALAGAVAAIVGCGFLGVAAGIWALVVLLRTEVREAFPASSGSPASTDSRRQWVAAVVAGLILLVAVSGAVTFGPLAGKHADWNGDNGLFPGVGEIIGAIAGDNADAETPGGETNTNWGITTNLADNSIDAGSAKDFRRSLKTGPAGKLTINADRGFIKLSVSDSNMVDIRVKREVLRAGAKTAARILRDQHLTLKRDGDNISLTTEEPYSLRHSWWKTTGLNVTYEITVPRKFAAHLDTLGGDVRVDGLQGDLYAKTAGGNVNLENLVGKTTGETMGGEVSAKNFAGPSIQAKTMGGEVAVDFSAAPTGDCYLHTMGGDVTAKIPANAALRLDAHTMGGDVKTELPVTEQGERHDNRLDGTVNGGGPLLKLETMGGEIRILRH
jgi:serine/threonine protein kinase